jgi:hypothetical protein
MPVSDGPIVDAVRQARARIAEECDYDWDRLAERLRKIERENADRVRRPQKPDAARSLDPPKD